MSFAWHGPEMMNSAVYGNPQQLPQQIPQQQVPIHPQMGIPSSGRPIPPQQHGMPPNLINPQINPQMGGVMGMSGMMVPQMMAQNPQGPQPGQPSHHQPESTPSTGVGSSGIPSVGNTVPGGGPEVCNVWKKNLPYHMSLIRHYLAQFNFVTVDVKFPGIVSRPIGTFHSTAEFHYQTLRSNIDLVEPLQIGLTLTDGQGNVPPGSNHMGTWQFNFKFDPKESMCSQEGLEVLKQSGLDLLRHQTDGIELSEFFEALTDSGVILNTQVTWITFYSGYDLGLLVSQLLGASAPSQKEDYLDLIKRYFPQVWDVKTLVKAFGLSTKSYLHEIAEDFQLFRGSAWSSAGSDSRLTALCFYEIMRTLGDHAYAVKNRLFGLEDDTAGGEEDLQMQVQRAQAKARAQAQAQAQTQGPGGGPPIGMPLVGSLNGQNSNFQPHGPLGTAGPGTNGAAGGSQTGGNGASGASGLGMVGSAINGMHASASSGPSGPGNAAAGAEAFASGIPSAPGMGPPMMPMHPYMFNPANPPAGGRQPMYYSR